MLLQPHGKWNGKTIALDDGHGIETAGKRSPDGMRENDFNRAVVAYCSEHLRRSGFRVLLVAPTDKDTPLAERVALANRHKVDLYLSVHANAFQGKWGNHGGIETYVDMRWPKTVAIAKIIHDEAMKGTALKDRKVKDGRHLYVCNTTDMHAVLVELGFMDSLFDSPFLKSDAYRKESAQELAIGVCKAFGVGYVAEQPPKQEQPTGKLYKVQIGAFASLDNAKKLEAEAKTKGFHVFIVHE